ncbi:MAG: hypothetical protein ACKOOL_10525, partial [Novosphingobium sp.]
REAAAFAAPRLAAAQAAEDSARAKADKARAAAAAAPDDGRKQEALSSAEAALTLAINSTRPYQAMADQAKAELDAAQADQDQLEARRAAWQSGTGSAPAADASAKN